MKSTAIRRALSAVGVAALVSASVLVGSTAAQAGDPANVCGSPSSIGTFVDFQTSGARWWELCTNTANIDDGFTANKTDALDGFGDITIDGQSDPVAAIPSFSGFVGADYVNVYTDEGFDIGGGDLVDIVVTQTFSGTFVRWEVSFFDAGTSTARTDVAFTVTGDIGCDGACLYNVTANKVLTFGDVNDPLLLWQLDATTYTIDTTDGSDNPSFHATGPAVLTLGLVDYGCDNDGTGDGYAAGILADGLDAHFGESLRAPGVEDCVKSAPVQLAPGQVFDLLVSLNLSSPPWDWSTGGYLDSDGLDWLDWDSRDSDAGQPGLRIFGTAPTTPGTYLLPIYVTGNAFDQYSPGFVTIIVAAPVLANTGTDLTAPVSVGAAFVGLGALALMVVRRRRSIQGS